MEQIKKCITPREEFSLDRNYLSNKSYGSDENINNIDYINYKNKKPNITYDEYISFIEQKYIKKQTKDNKRNINCFCFYIRVLFCME